MLALVLSALVALLSGCHSIDTVALPRLYTGLWAVVPVRSTGGDGPLVWSATGLPDGLAINSASGVISGTPKVPGVASVTVTAVDPAANGASVSKTYALEVDRPAPPVVFGSLGITMFQNEAMSADGRYIFFVTSDGSTIEDPPPGGYIDPTYVLWDRTTQIGTPIFTDHDGTEDLHGTSISGDGRYLAYVDVAATETTRLVVLDRTTGQSETIPNAAGTLDWHFRWPVVSGDGRFVAYRSWIPGTSRWGIYLYDRSTATTTTVATTQAGAAMIDGEFAFSADGSTVAFTAADDGLVPEDHDGQADIFVWNRETGSTRRITGALRPVLDAAGAPAVSADGRSVAYSGRASSSASGELLVWDATSGTTTRPGIDSPGVPGISADGATVVAASGVLWERSSGVVLTLPQPGPTYRSLVSQDGRYVSRAGGQVGPGIWTWDRYGTTG